MPKTAVQIPVCDICGAEVREGSQFCYNCGGSLMRKAAGEKTEVIPPEAIAPAPASTGKGDAGKEKPTDQRGARRRRPVDRGPVEVFWEPREGVSVSFVIASVFLLLIALILFVIAMWIK